MEPYRPYVDQLVLDVMARTPDYSVLTREVKAQLLSVPVLDVTIDGERRPLMIAASMTTASLYKCFSGELRRMAYPSMS